MALPIRQNLKQSVRTFSVEVHLDLTAKIPGANEAQTRAFAKAAEARGEIRGPLHGYSSPPRIASTVRACAPQQAL